MVRLADFTLAASLLSGFVIADMTGCIGKFVALRCMRPGPIPPLDPEGRPMGDRKYFKTGYTTSCCSHGTVYTDDPDGAYCCTNRDIEHWNQFDSCCTASRTRDTVTLDD
ncbi:hypothetical protein BFJ63_vAg19121 [Fusarium oxysporum f. sp. narcissi]|uniref:Uncharacterized protein n=1 Tax=Fusarium oxysporum f. sp. narcissi TaxID=451672 RepID=A0A4Q2UUM7_FUSOX|nr:hypothetical protein BFJ63_vAg19121 [Fusarium oxysporum f. sp. narcissi]